MKKFTRKLLLASCVFMFLSNMAVSQEKNELVTIDKLSIEGRVDFDYFNRDGSYPDDNSVIGPVVPELQLQASTASFLTLR